MSEHLYNIQNIMAIERFDSEENRFLPPRTANEAAAMNSRLLGMLMAEEMLELRAAKAHARGNVDPATPATTAVWTTSEPFFDRGALLPIIRDSIV